VDIDELRETYQKRADRLNSELWEYANSDGELLQQREILDTDGSDEPEIIVAEYDYLRDRLAEIDSREAFLVRYGYLEAVRDLFLDFEEVQAGDE
jgi:hypothetical protein